MARGPCHGAADAAASIPALAGSSASMVMVHVRQLLTADELIALEDSVPDPSTQAAFNRLGVCIRPGRFDEEEYKFGEFKRLTDKEVEREANLRQQAALYDESQRARQTSVCASKRILDLEAEERLEEEKHRKKMKQLKEEREQLHAKVVSCDLEAATKQEKAQAMALAHG